MTPTRWRRQRDAQRLLNLYTARLAEQAAAPPRMTMNVNGLGQREIVPLESGIGPGHIIALDEAAGIDPRFVDEFARVMARRMERDLNIDFSGMLMGGVGRLGVDPDIPEGPIRYQRIPPGRLTTGREILDQQQGIVRGARRGQRRTRNPQYIGENNFSRWLDVYDSEHELQKFILACYKYGDEGRANGEMSVKQLEGG